MKHTSAEKEVRFNVLAITFDGRSISSTAKNERQAFIKLAEWIDEETQAGRKPLARFFIGTEQGVMEYTESEVKSESIEEVA